MTNVLQEEIDVLESDFRYCFLRFLLQAQNKLAKTMPLNSSFLSLPVLYDGVVNNNFHLNRTCQT